MLYKSVRCDSNKLGTLVVTLCVLCTSDFEIMEHCILCKSVLVVCLSPQIALVKWTESVGLTLVDRDLVSMTTEGPAGERDRYEILQLFPFTSERKRMGIILRVSTTAAFSHSYIRRPLCVFTSSLYTHFVFRIYYVNV